MILLFMIAAMLCTTNVYCGTESNIQDVQAPFLHTIRSTGISTQIVHNVEQHGFLISEHCYAASKNPDEYPLVILDASPCIAAFIKSSRGKTTMAFHISAYDDPEAMLPIIDTTFNFDKNNRIREQLYLTLFTLTTTLFDYGKVDEPSWFNEGDHRGRLEAIIKVFTDNYTLINPQYHFCPEDRFGNDSSHCVCAGFDEANQRLQVYSINFEKTAFKSDQLSASKIVKFTEQVKNKTYEHILSLENLEDSSDGTVNGRTTLLYKSWEKQGKQWEMPFYSMSSQPNLPLLFANVEDPSAYNLNASAVAATDAPTSNQNVVQPTKRTIPITTPPQKHWRFTTQQFLKAKGIPSKPCVIVGDNDEPKKSRSFSSYLFSTHFLIDSSIATFLLFVWFGAKYFTKSSTSTESSHTVNQAT